MEKKLIKPTEAELDILQILWSHKPATVRYVYDKLSEKKNVVYTTILKTMQIMLKKKLVERETSERNHLYSPLVKEEETKSILLDKFINSVFKGSARGLMMHLLGEHTTSDKEIEEIKKLLADKRLKNK